MARRARGYRSAPPTFRFTPGIVEHGEVMALTRRTFVVPDETPRPQGRRTMTVGRKSYSWSTARDIGPVNRRPVSETLSDEDVQVRRQVSMIDYVEPPPSNVTAEDRQRYGLPSPVVISYSKVTVDENLRALPRRERPVKAPKSGKVPRQKSAPREQSDRDQAVRQYLVSKGLGAAVQEITPAIRAAALEALEAERQLSEYSAV
jgi:hypothetical protein